MNNLKESKRVTAFLEANGWECIGYDKIDEFMSFVKPGAVGIDVSNERIVFIGESGDFADIPLNYYTLLGFMYHHRLLQPVIPNFDEVQG
jgi:hypothetical protein